MASFNYEIANILLHYLNSLNELLLQADLKYPLGIFILASLLLGFIAVLAAGYLLRSFILGLLCLPLGCAVPFGFIIFKRNKRMAKFERQLPDALGLMARALKAGHAFTGGLQMVVQEFDAPISAEFQKVLNEIDYGSGVEQSLVNLTGRVNCPDLKFFAVSLIVQREPGGDLAEILDKIAELIRSRFKFQDRVKTLFAEGKLSAIILILIPIFIAAVLMIINPGYIDILFKDSFGEILIAISIIMGIVGVIVMRRMVAIKV